MDEINSGTTIHVRILGSIWHSAFCHILWMTALINLLEANKITRFYTFLAKSSDTSGLSYTAKTMHADALVALGDKASAGMILTPQSGTIWSLASEELNHHRPQVYWQLLNIVVVAPFFFNRSEKNCARIDLMANLLNEPYICRLCKQWLEWCVLLANWYSSAWNLFYKLFMSSWLKSCENFLCCN